MRTLTPAAGLRVTLPESIEIAPAPSAPKARGRTGSKRSPGVVPLPSPSGEATSGEAQRLAEAMSDQDMELVAVLPLKPRALPAQSRRGTPVAESQEVKVDMDLAADEGAVVLLEQDGVYAWHLDGEESAAVEPSLPVTRGGVRRRDPAATRRQVTFRLPLGTTPQGAKRRGWLSDLVVGHAQAFVFKYAGRFLLNRGVAFLERKTRTGLVRMDVDDPTKWEDLPDFSAIELPSDRPARILLFVHGTFSSTRGGFGALGATPWGRAFLASARASYDAVVGFDHPTLSVDPLVNATALLRCLEARTWDHPAMIDAVSHSRGGITLRSLIENLLPATSLPIRIERAVFLGAVNGGTQLAEPKNLKTFINLYTNLAAAACRAIAMFPQATFAATLLEELVKSVGAFAKVLAEQAITEGVIPGMSAMQPSGAFIRDLNLTQPGQPTAENSRYYAVTSEFKSRLALDSPEGLPRQLLLSVADGAVDQLMGEANDLVVNTESMTHVDPDAGTFIKDTLAFGTNGIVYHTNYFLQPQVSNALARWFELEVPEVASPARLRGTVRGGAMAPLSVPARVDTDVLVVQADETCKEARVRIREHTPSYVVVNRFWNGERLHYAFQTEEVLTAIARQPGAILIDALGLHETDKSPEGSLDRLPQADPNAPGPTLRRAVALDGERVIGVAEARVVPTPLTELVRQAKQVTVAKNEEEKVLKRRTMPTFTTRSTSGAAPVFIAAPVPGGPSRGPSARTMKPIVLRQGPRAIPASRGAVSVPISSPSPGTTRGFTRSKPYAPLPPPPAPVTRGAKPSKKPASEAAMPTAVPTKVTCHFLAEMEDEVVVGETTSVDVTLSREVLAAVREVSASGKSEVKTDRGLTVELIPKKNFIAAGETRVEAPLPQPGSPDQYIFDVTPTDAGDGEILVRIRQGAQPIANLQLKAEIVKKRTRPPVRRPQEASVLETPPGPEPRHELSIFELERGGKRLYQYILRSPSLGVLGNWESRAFEGSREDFIKGVYEDIESRYLSSQTDYEQFQQELREVGGGLWDELFPEELQAALWKHRDKIDSIMVLAEEPFIPWELVHLKEPKKGLPRETRFFGQMGLVRWLHNIGWPPTELHAREGHCRYVIPSYPHPEYVLPEAEAEAEFLEKRFKATPVDPHLGPVRGLLDSPGAFDLLHFACHGVADSADIQRAELLLEGRVEGANYIMEKFRASVVEHLSGLAGSEGIHPIVTLNACQAGRAGYKMTSIGGFARAFLKQDAGMFTAAMWSVGDNPARTFTETLYDRLLKKDTLAQATIVAREAARKEREATWLAYTVYGNPHARLIR